MRLLEAVAKTNRQFAVGDRTAVLGAEWAGQLPLVAITCIDPRLTSLLPAALGLKDEEFIWLRNAGNVVAEPLDATLRSLALACAIKGGKEIAVIGHTDCKAAQTSMLDLLARLAELGVDRAALPPNLPEFFGCCASERQNVLRAVEVVRRSPLIGPRVPVHGLLIDVVSGRFEWLVNGYDVLAGVNSVVEAAPAPAPLPQPPPLPAEPIRSLPPKLQLASEAVLQLPKKLARRPTKFKYS